MQVLKKDDEWMTPSWYWDLIKPIIEGRVIWEPFYGNGQSSKDLSKLCAVKNTKKQNFFDVAEPPIVDFVLTNPPFSKKIKIIKHLEKLGLNYILLLPAHFMFSQFWQNKCRDNPNYSVGIAPKRMGFVKKGRSKSSCPFNCAFFFKGVPTKSHYFHL